MSDPVPDDEEPRGAADEEVPADESGLGPPPGGAVPHPARRRTDRSPRPRAVGRPRPGRRPR